MKSNICCGFMLIRNPEAGYLIHYLDNVGCRNNDFESAGNSNFTPFNHMVSARDHHLIGHLIYHEIPHTDSHHLYMFFSSLFRFVHFLIASRRVALFFLSDTHTVIYTNDKHTHTHTKVHIHTHTQTVRRILWCAIFAPPWTFCTTSGFYNFSNETHY